MGPCSKLLLWQLMPVFLAPTRGGPPAAPQGGAVVTAAPGANVTLRCVPHGDMVTHFSWYRQGAAGPPRLLSTVYKFEREHPPSAGQGAGSRFEVRLGDRGHNHLRISDARCEDSALYYCASAHSNVVEFRDAMFLHVRGSEDEPQREWDARRFWCDLYHRAGGEDACRREDGLEAWPPSEGCGRGNATEDTASEVRVLVLLSIGRTAALLLCWIVAGVVCCALPPPCCGL